ncbi:GAF domain-containing sensor histidine kinase [Pelagibius sp.]|uniref:GAF domain-containing sensor histidine kinase n=1 Tax=Pelagibius sp. TaxID=1931238 RepID=UPI00260D4DFD|nr:GAF domain-containing sensor histidine kinase [Pelagibius sp.]
MQPIPFDELQRLASLQAMEILDTPPEPAFDRITRLAADHFNVPIALISLIDPARQWFKSKVGLDVEETPREISFCQFTIMDDQVLQVSDARQDPRFAENPLVTGGPGIRFYAGAPLVTQKGFRLGTLCLIDSQVRAPLNETQEAQLRDFADLVISEMDLRRLRRLLGEECTRLSKEAVRTVSRIGEAEADLARDAQMDLIAHVAHELRTPLGGMLNSAEVIRGQLFGPIGDPRYAAYASHIEDCGHHLLEVLRKTMELARSTKGGLMLEESELDMNGIALAAEKLVQGELDKYGVRLAQDLERAELRLLADRSQVSQMLVNLICNAARHVAAGAEITLRSRLSRHGDLTFSVVDRGCGMTAEELRAALTPFGQIASKRTKRHEGLGVGLPLTKRLVELHGGELTVESTPGQGTTVSLNFPAYRVRLLSNAQQVPTPGPLPYDAVSGL